MALLCLMLVGAGSLRAQDQLALTGNVRRNQSATVSFRVSPEAAAALFDGSLDDSKSFDMPRDGTIRIDFAEPVFVTHVVVYEYNDPKRSYNAARDATLRVWDGERAVGKPVVLDLSGDPELRLGADSHIVWSGRAAASLPVVAPATALTLDVRKKPGAFQSMLREVEVWGMPVAWTKLAWARVQATVDGNTPSSLRIEWPRMPRGTKYVRVRYRQRNERAWRTACFTASPGLILGLTPGATYEAIVDARVPAGSTEPPAGPIQRVKLCGPLEVRTVADILGMNFYPGGGGVHQARPDEAAMTLRMCRLMQEAGVRHVRWWPPCPAGAELFAEYGMGFLPSLSANVTPARVKRASSDWGICLADTGNEPDFNQVLPADYVASLRKMKAADDKAGHPILLLGPTFGGELVGPGSDYLDACYRHGMKGMLDALDLHPYVKYATPTPPGGRVGGPEGVLYDLARAREDLRRNGEPDLPITVSEAGHPTCEGHSSLPGVTYEQQAQRVVRSHLLMIAAGVRRIWWYAFQDEGTDRSNVEDCFGLVDWHGKPKPAYAAYKAMVQRIGDTVCDGLQPDAKPPVYAVRFRGPHGYVTAIWDSGGESEVRLAGKVLAAHDLYGHAAVVEPGDRPVTKATESVLYLTSSQPLRIVSAKRLAPPVTPQVHMDLSPTTVAFTPGKPFSWVCRVSNQCSFPVEVELVSAGPWGLPQAKTTFVFSGKSTHNAVLGWTAPLTVKNAMTSWDVTCRYRKAGTHDGWKWFTRAIFFVKGGY